MDTTVLVPEGRNQKFTVDPRRALIQAERHARPPVPVAAPAICQHLVFHNEQGDLAQERRVCLNICEQLELMPSSELNDQIKAEGGSVTLKWERHTEYSSYTFIAQDVKDRKGFRYWTERDLPWDAVVGKLLVSMVIGVEKQGNAAWSKTGRFDWSGDKPLCASLVMGNMTIIESDLDIDDAGHTRYLIKTNSNESSRLGRLVQRLLEIESYGALCLYAWKDVKEIGPQLGEAERGLGDIINRLAEKSDQSDEDILAELTELSAFQEATTAKSHFRLNASLAYHEIVTRRLGELREERIEGCQRLANFIQRRMNPAARTYRAILTRQHETADRISRATQLLRGRIDVTIGKQNQDLLHSMNSRAEAQFKLQKTVEGLSTVAISYYALGIIGYLAAAFIGYLGGVSVKEIVGFSAPFVLLAVWFGVRKLRE